jgi:hypothetical protein
MSADFLSTYPFRNDVGKVTQVNAMSTTIPPRKSRVAQIRESRREIERSNAERKTYLKESEEDFKKLSRDAQRSPSTMLKRFVSRF